MSEATLNVAVAGGPLQWILRPAELEDQRLFESLAQRALFGRYRVFALGQSPTNRCRDAGALVLEQRDAAIRVDGHGSVVVAQNARENQGSSGFGLPVLLEEHLADRLRGALGFILETLGEIDPVARLGQVVIVCGLLGAQACGWRTLEEHRASPNSMTMSMPPDRIVVTIPRLLSRAAFKARGAEVAQDLLVLLRQRVRGAAGQA